MNKARKLAYWIVGCLVILGIPLWLDWMCDSKPSKNLRADYLAGLSRLAGKAGFAEEEFKLDLEAERIRNNWLNVVIDCQSEQEMSLLDGHLLAEAIGKSIFTEHVQRTDGSWALHLVVENELERDRVRKRVASLRFEFASATAKQAALGNPQPGPSRHE